MHGRNNSLTQKLIADELYVAVAHRLALCCADIVKQTPEVREDSATCLAFFALSLNRCRKYDFQGVCACLLLQRACATR